MRQWALQSKNFKGSSLLAMAGAVALVVGTAACGGGGSSSSVDEGTTLSGLASDGLLSGATVNVYSRDSATVCTSTTTTTTGTYTLKVPASCAAPLRIEVSGGTDLTTNRPNDLTLKSIVTSSTQTTANLSPQTTLMTHAMLQASGGTLTALAGKSSAEQAQLLSTAATAVMQAFGFGADANLATFNPMTTPITTAAMVSAYKNAADAAGEVIRRLTSSLGTASSNSVALAMQEIGQMLGGDTTSAAIGGGSSLSTTSLQALLSAQNAVVSAEIMKGSLSRNVIASTGGLSSAGTLNTTSALSALSTKFLQQIKKDITVALSLNVLSQAIYNTLNTAANTALSNNGQVAAVTISGTALSSTISSTVVSNISTTATAALNAVNFRVQPEVTVTDYPAGTVASAVEQTLEQNVSNRVMTADVGTTNQNPPLNATNLSNVAHSTGMAPTINFELDNLTSNRGTGVAIVTATLIDGDDDTRDSGERYLSANTAYNWSNDGTTLTLTAPANGVAAVTYYTANATAPAAATLTNTEADLMTVTQDGASVPATLKLKIASLFSRLSATSLNANATAGNYYYKVTITGMPLSACDFDETTCTPANAKPFTTVQGMIAAE
ncbi:MAG: hypothetical protein HQM00_03380 [Magnetococcales bacterium]|nr:hypothetical protein [Magnetococcales bacterium]